MKSYIPAILALSLLSACTALTGKPPAIIEPPYENYDHIFTSVGYAAIEVQPGDSVEMKILNAIKASKLDAYKEMAEQIHGVLITAGGSAKRSILNSDAVDGKVKGLVRGARVLKSYHEGEVYITELELDMNTLPYLNAPEFHETGRSMLDVYRGVYY